MKWFTQKLSGLAFAPFLRDTVMISLLSIFLIGPLLTPNWIKMGESIDQVLRVIELDRGIREGYLYPRWFGDLAGGFGYPFFVFYSPLIYYVAEVFHLLGFGVVTSLKCMIILGVILAGTGMFLFAKSFWGIHGAMVSALAYVYAPYRIVNLYVRGDLAEAFAMSLLPLILYFYYHWLRGNNRLHLVGAVLTYAALILTHNCTALIFSGLLALFVLFVSAQNKNWSAVWKGFLAVILGCGVSAVFWLPALLEKTWVNIELIYSNQTFDFHHNFLEPYRFLSPVWTFDAGIGGRNLPFQIGAPHILLAMFSVLLIMKSSVSKEQDAKKVSMFFLLSGITLLFLTHSSSAGAWEVLPLIKYVQFPWRLLSLLSLCVSFLCGGLFCCFVTESKMTQQMLQIILIVIIILSGAQYCCVNGYYILDEANLTPSFIRKQGGTTSSFNTNEMDSIINFGEYLPKSVKKLPDKKKAGRVFMSKGKARILNLKTWIQRYEFDTTVEEDAEIVIGTFYYPSWMARIDSKGVPLFTNEEGLIHLKVPKGEHHIEVFFADTTARRTAKYVSLLSFLAVLAFVLGRPLKRMSKPRPKVASQT